MDLIGYKIYDNFMVKTEYMIQSSELTDGINTEAGS